MKKVLKNILFIVLLMICTGAIIICLMSLITHLNDRVDNTELWMVSDLYPKDAIMDMRYTNRTSDIALVQYDGNGGFKYLGICSDYEMKEWARTHEYPVSLRLADSLPEAYIGTVCAIYADMTTEYVYMDFDGAGRMFPCYTRYGVPNALEMKAGRYNYAMSKLFGDSLIWRSVRILAVFIFFSIFNYGLIKFSERRDEEKKILAWAKAEMEKQAAEAEATKKAETPEEPEEPAEVCEA